MTEVRTREEAATEIQSLALIKNMLRISVSSICYFRDLFSKECFSSQSSGFSSKLDFVHILTSADHQYDDLGNVVSARIRDSGAFLLTQWLEKGVFSAIEMGYLSNLQFAVYTSHPITNADLLLETYEFKMSYPTVGNPGRGTSINSVEVTKKTLGSQAGKFVRSLIEFSKTLDDLPEQRWITLQLEYNETCPADYEPEYFQASAMGITGFDGGHKFIRIKIGEVNSSYHTISIQYRGLESMREDSLKAMTPMSSAARAQSKVSTDGQSSAFKGKATPQECRGTDNKQSGARSSAVADSIKQLILSSQAVPTTPVELLELCEAHSDAQNIHEYLLEHSDATISAMSRDLDMTEVMVKAACEELVSKGLVQSRGRTRYSLQDQSFHDVITDGPAARNSKPIPLSHRKVPSAPKKMAKETGRMDDSMVMEPIDSFDSDPSDSKTPHMVQPKLRLQKGSASLTHSSDLGMHLSTAVDSAGSIHKRGRGHEEATIPLSQTSDVEGDGHTKKKKRSIIKQPIKLVRPKVQDDEFETQKSLASSQMSQ